MGSELKYEHLKATPAEEEEVVILAGMQDGETEDSVSTVDTSASSERVVETISERVNATSNTDEIVVQQKRADYHATDLDDITSSKMPVAQIVVIVVALVCVCAFIIWYLVFS